MSVEKKRFSLTLTEPYLRALDQLVVEEGIYLEHQVAIRDALRRLFQFYGIEPFCTAELPPEDVEDIGDKCPSDIPDLLRGRANACLAGGPKTEEYPGGQFCSYLESLGKCKLDIEESES